MGENNELLLKYKAFIDEISDKFQANDDFKQLIYLIVLEFDHNKLKKLDEKNQLRYYLVRLMKNQGFSKTSRYFQLYRNYYKRNELLKVEY